MSSLRPCSSRGSSGIHPLLSKHQSDTHIDAASCPLCHLRQAIEHWNQHRLLLHDLDFVNLHDDIILQLFYKADRHDIRSLDSGGNIILPPPTHRHTARQIKEFFDLGKKQKNQIIGEFSNNKHIIDTAGTIKYCDSVYCEESLEDAKPAPKKEPSNPPQPQHQEQAHSDYDMPEQPAPISVCMGITINHLKTMMTLSDERFEELSFGFVDTYRESFMTRLRLENARNLAGGWKYAPPVVGALTGNDKNRVVWTCTEIVDQGSEPFLLGNDIDFGRYTFRHAECDVSDTNVKQGLCCHCLRAKPLLMRRFDSNLRLHTEEFNPN